MTPNEPKMRPDGTSTNGGQMGYDPLQMLTESYALLDL